MRSDIYIYTVSLPTGINEAVTPCADGYTIYLSDKLSAEKRMEAYEHAMKHINNLDFEKYEVQDIEAEAHG